MRWLRASAASEMLLCGEATQWRIGDSRRPPKWAAPHSLRTRSVVGSSPPPPDEESFNNGVMGYAAGDSSPLDDACEWAEYGIDGCVSDGAVELRALILPCITVVIVVACAGIGFIALGIERALAESSPLQNHRPSSGVRSSDTNTALRARESTGALDTEYDDNFSPPRRFRLGSRQASIELTGRLICCPPPGGCQRAPS